MSEHVLKVEAPYFAALADGSKTFEVRRNDRAYQAGDILRLREWNSTVGRWAADIVLVKRVTFVYSGDPRFGGHGGLQPGYVVLGLAEVKP